MEQDSIQKRISNSIRNNDPLAVAYLFGSRARGDYRTDSDWDILILVNETKVTNDIEDKFRDELYDIELDSGQVISTFIYPKDYWNNTLIYSPLYKNISKDGIKL
ncbi:MAG: nucleotidyltransferase domain-containing protein [Salinivirgaceae bacterium]|jgi:predicted nucleotidyltransferase